MSDSVEPMAISTTPLNPPRHITSDDDDDQDDGWGDTPINTITTNDDKPSSSAASSLSSSSSSASSTIPSATSLSSASSTSTSPTPSQLQPSTSASEASTPAPTTTYTNTTSMPPPTINPAVLRISQLRLQSDLKALETDPPDGISANPLDPENLYLWRACIFGPEDTPWEGGVFQLRITFPKEYPQKPPTVRFTSKMFHPNVFADGTLCLDIIQDQWSPIYTVSMILTSIQSLLTDPNPASPANPEAAKLLHDDPKEYRKRVRACAAKATM